MSNGGGHQIDFARESTQAKGADTTTRAQSRRSGAHACVQATGTAVAAMVSKLCCFALPNGQPQRSFSSPALLFLRRWGGKNMRSHHLAIGVYFSRILLSGDVWILDLPLSSRMLSRMSGYSPVWDPASEPNTFQASAMSFPRLAASGPTSPSSYIYVRPQLHLLEPIEMVALVSRSAWPHRLVFVLRVRRSATRSCTRSACTVCGSWTTATSSSTRMTSTPRSSVPSSIRDICAHLDPHALIIIARADLWVFVDKSEFRSWAIRSH